MKKPTILRRTILAFATAIACFGGTHTAAYSEDIDVFSAAPSENDIPNILLALDNSANWGSTAPTACSSYSDGSSGPNSSERGKRLGVMKCAIVNTLLALPTADDGSALFRVGIMLINESPNDGGYARKNFVPLTAANKTALIDTIKNLSLNGDKSNAADFARMLWEGYLWYKGEVPYNGNKTTSKVDASAFSGGRFVSPSKANCARNFIILITNGAPQGGESDIATKISAAGGDATQISYPNSYVGTSDQSNTADETARFLKTVDVSSKEGIQNISVYTVAIQSTSPTPSETKQNNFIAEIAKKGGGQYYPATDTSSVTVALLDIFNQIQSVDSVFTATTLPVSTTTQGSYLNQLFIGMFRPDGNAKPRWWGNLKQYKLGYNKSTGDVELVDAAGNAAIQGNGGYFSPTAKSFWTTNSNFFAESPSGNPVSASDSPDGQIVEKGGVAQRIREANFSSTSSRKVYTMPATAPAANTLLSTYPLTTSLSSTTFPAALFGATTTTERDALIEWARGTNNVPSSSSAAEYVGRNAAGDAATVRPSVHGDILHSRPAAVNYGDGRVVIFYGANDGLLRAVEGKQTGTGAGNELWAFAAPEHLNLFKRQRNQTPELAVAGVTFSGNQPKDYAFDGPIGVYAVYGSDGAPTKVIIYVGMRRGGNALYAFDVTNPDTPKFLWRVNRASTEFGLLGQTWSMAKPFKSPVETTVKPILIMGGGYDPKEDADSEPTCSVASPCYGKHIYVIDGANGTVLKKFSTDAAVPGDVSVVDSNNDGKIDRAYAGDLGGNIYRINMTNSAGVALPYNDWTIKKIAALSSGSNRRKIFFQPDVVTTNQFVAVLVGSGDREKPLDTTSSDGFVLIKDTLIGQTERTTALRVSDLAQIAEVDETTHELGEFTATDDPDGCYIALGTDGEKVVNAPYSFGGITYFGTNRPEDNSASNSCSGSLGQARSYQFPLFCAKPTSTVLEGGGLPPSPVGGLVSIDVDGQEKLVPFVIGAGEKGSAFEAVRPRPPIPPVRKRNFWYINNNNR